MSKASIFNSEWEDLIRSAARGAGSLPAIQDRLTSMETNIMAALDYLKQEVAELKSVNQSVLALINGMADKLKNAADSGDWSEVEKVASELDAEAAALTAAVVANTPAATEPPAPEAPPAEPTS